MNTTNIEALVKIARDSARTPADLWAAAGRWQARANEVSGRTEAGGWSSREVYDAERRAAYCIERRDICNAVADRIEKGV